VLRLVRRDAARRAYLILGHEVRSSASIGIVTSGQCHTRARSTRQLLETVELFERRKIGLKTITQNIDTTNAGGRLIFTVFGVIAEFEREISRERTRAGLDAVRSRGRKGGRPRSLSDKDLKQARALLNDPEITVEEVARRFGVGPSTLYRYLPAARQTAQDEA